MTVSTETEITPEELLKLPDNVGYELVDGKLVERHMGTESSEIAIRIAILIGIFLRNHSLGKLFGSDASYQCFPKAPKMIRRADLSFIRFGRLPGDKAPKGHCRIAPDLAVEVVSPGDTAEEVDTKVSEYLEVGVRLIWVVHPSTRTVAVHRPAGAPLSSPARLTAADTITGEDVLPGFSCPVKSFFE
jgi:Uma2 family endonuclease